MYTKRSSSTDHKVEGQGVDSWASLHKMEEVHSLVKVAGRCDFPHRQQIHELRDHEQVPAPCDRTVCVRSQPNGWRTETPFSAVQ